MFSCESCSARSDSWWHCLDCNVNLCARCRDNPAAGGDTHQPDHVFAEYRGPEKLSESEIKEEYAKCLAALDDKQGKQGGVPTFFDRTLRTVLRTSVDAGGNIDPALFDGTARKPEHVLLLDVLRRQRMGRYVDYFSRKGIERSEISSRVMNFSQGAFDCIRWKERVLFKTVFDLAIYQTMLAELRPNTIIEIGSGDGGSAMWFADIAEAQGVHASVYSLDIRVPRLEYPNVTFIRADCENLGASLERGRLEQWPHPWLLIEDAHVNVQETLQFFDAHLQEGDYLVVEDSRSKRNILGKFMLDKTDRYKVDTRYTDLTGQNATCSLDSIFKRVK